MKGREGFERLALLKSHDMSLHYITSEALNALQGESGAESTVLIRFQVQ